MITTNLYPDRYEVKMGETTDEYSAWRTSGFNTTYDGATVEDVESYFLGYISSDNMPYSYGMTAIYYDEDGKLIFKNITENNNYPCGYAHNSADSDSQRIIYYERNGNRTWGTNVNQVTLFNQNYPMYSGRSNRSSIALGLTFNYVIYDGGGNLFITTQEPGVATYTFQTVGEVLRFFRGETKIDVSLTTYSGTPLRVKLDTENFAEGNAYLPIEDSPYFVRIFITDFQSTTGAEARNGGLYSTMLPQFMVKTTAEFNGENFTLVSSGCDSTASYSINYIESQSPTEDNPLILYGNAFSGEFVETQFDTLYLSLVVFGDNMVVERQNWGLTTSIVHSLTEIQHAFYLAYRGDTTVNSYTIGYKKDVTYATDVSSSNEFLARWKTGDLEDPNFRIGLRDWQYEEDGFQEENFEEEDVPGYQPGGGDPSEDPRDDEEKEYAPDKEDWGDPMNPNNGFQIIPDLVNYKAFSAEGIDNFSERLWDAPDDFWEALTISNKNNANWLDYFISLRAYPYWINSTGEEANIYVGAGAKFYLGDEGTDLYASNPQHISFFVLNFNISKFYNNFLDFEPYTKAYVYLPFSGTWEVNPKYLYHTSLQILLKLDITDGSGVWQLVRSGTDTAGSGYIILEKQCKIGVEIPLSGLNAATMSSNIVNATLGNYQRLGNQIGKIAGVAAGAAGGFALGGPVGAVLGVAGGAAMTGLENSVDMANANREQVTVTGGMSGLAAANCNVIPSITLVRPIAENPDSFPHTVGHLVNKSATLSRLIGFTTCRNVDVSNVSQATDKEKAQLKKILENGFFA